MTSILQILNLFLALLLASFGSNASTDSDDEENKIVEAIDRIKRFVRFLTRKICCYSRRKRVSLVEIDTEDASMQCSIAEQVCSVEGQNNLPIFIMLPRFVTEIR